MCRAQTYDGAGNMAGCQNGCAKLFQKISPRALHFHCASHQLNLVLSHASKVPEIHNMVCTLKLIGVFFKYSPKRQREFEKCILAIGGSQENEKSESEDVIMRELSDTESDDDDDYYEDIDMEETGSRENEEQTVKDSPRSQAAKKEIKPICETRWVERHTAFEDFNDLYEALLLCLSTVAENTGNRKWDAKSKTEAQGLLHQISTSGFIVAFHTALYLFGYTKGLSKSLQGSTLDVVEAHKHVSLVRDELQSVHRNAKHKFSLLYDKMKKMSNHGGVEISMPRRCGRQTLCSNIKAKKTITYFRRAIFLPFLDSLLQQLQNRFEGLSVHALQGLLLIPSNLEKLEETPEKLLVQHYAPDLHSASSASQELQLWKRRWYVHQYLLYHMCIIELIKPMIFNIFNHVLDV